MPHRVVRPGFHMFGRTRSARARTGSSFHSASRHPFTSRARGRGLLTRSARGAAWVSGDRGEEGPPWPRSFPGRPPMTDPNVVNRRPKQLAQSDGKRLRFPNVSAASGPACFSGRHNNVQADPGTRCSRKTGISGYVSYACPHIPGRGRRSCRARPGGR